MAPPIDAPSSTPVEPPRGAKSSWPKRLIALLVFGGGAAYGVHWYVGQIGYESTDDAQVDAEIVAVPSRMGGIVVEVLVEENARVKAGQLLARLDDAQAKARLAQTEAALVAAQAVADAALVDVRLAAQNADAGKASAEASLATAAIGVTATADQIKEASAQVRSTRVTVKHAQRELARAKALFDSGVSTRVAYDQAINNLDMANAALSTAQARVTTLKQSVAQAESRVTEANVKVTQTSDVDSLVKVATSRAASAKAQVAVARAARDLAKLDLEHLRILAPQDGVMSKKSVSVGQAIAPGQPVGQLVTDERWITANFKETQLEQMAPGETVSIVIDAFEGLALTGTVESVAGATGSRFALLPPDNASGNYTKVVQRVPVRIRLDASPAKATLRPGMSAIVKVDTNSPHHEGGAPTPGNTTSATPGSAIPASGAPTAQAGGKPQ